MTAAPQGTPAGRVRREHRCEVVAHRGGGAEAAENTWEAVAHTVELGLEWMETDLRATCDGVVVLAHDASLARTVGDERTIGEMTWEELSQVDAGDGKPPVRLDEVLERYPALYLNTDLKDATVIAPAARIVEEAGALERVRFASFSARRLAQLRRLLPQARTSIGMRDVAALVGLAAAGMGRSADALVERLVVPRAARSASGSAQPGDLRQPGAAPQPGGAAGGEAVRRPDAIQVPERQYGLTVVSPRLVAAAHTAGLEVHVWTVNDSTQMRRLAGLGVDAVITDVPRLALAVLDGSER